MSVYLFDMQEPHLRCPACEREFAAQIRQKWMFNYTRCTHCHSLLRPDFKTRMRTLFCGLLAMVLLLVIVTGLVPFPSRSEPLTYGQLIWFATGLLLLVLLAIMKKHAGWETSEKHTPQYHQSGFYEDDEHFKSS